MKQYVLEGSINGQPMSPRIFLTRKDAEQELSKILDWRNLQVEDDRHPQKHTEEFVCNQLTRFFIRRVGA